MKQQKNDGPPLTNTFRGSFRNIPDEFLAKVGLKTVVTKVNTDKEIEEPSGLVVETKLEQEGTDERKESVTTLLSDPRDEPLVSQVRLPSGQIGTLTRRLVDEGTPLTADVLTEQGEQKNLGNGFLDETKTQAPEIFQEIELSQEVDDPFPERWRFAIPRTLTQEIVEGEVAAPTLTANQLKVSERQLTNYRKLVTELVRSGASLPVTLISYRTNDKGQVVTVTETLRVISTVPVPSATQNVVTQNLDNVNEVVIVEALPSVFPANKYSKEREDVTPSEFRVAIPTTETIRVEEGTAVMPTLGASDLSATQEQLTQFVRLIRTFTRAGVSLPVSLVGKDTNNRGQVVTVTRTLRIAGSDPVPTATREVVVQSLGDGNVVETKREIDAVFGKNLYEKELLDLFPPEFKALLATEKTEVITTGTAGNPSLGTGDLRKSEEQLTMFTKIITLLTRAGLSFPIVLTNTATTTEFGGGKVNIIRTLADSGTVAVQEGEAYISSKITELGEGHVIRETVVRQAAEWPTLHGAEIDDSWGHQRIFAEQVVENGSISTGTFGEVTVEAKPIDGYRAQKIVSVADWTTLDNIVLSFPSTTNVDFPPILESVVGQIEKVQGNGEYDETGSAGWAGHGSWSLSLRGTAQASGSCLPDVIVSVKQIWGNDIPCVSFLFFMENSKSLADILARLSTFVADTVLAWPRFCPRAHTILLVGQRMNLTVNVSNSSSNAGDGTGSSFSATSGTGETREAGVTVKSVRIPPTIHPTIPVTGATADSIGMEVDARINVGYLLPNITRDSTVYGAITPTSLPATPGATSVPTSGFHLHRLRTEPYRYGRTQRLMVDAEVINFADFPQ